MKNTVPMVVSEKSFREVFSFAEDNSALAKNLYNAALFRIRQVFTGWGKEKLTDLQKLVFDELEQTKAAYEGFTPRRVLSYQALLKILRATSNPDYFAGLPMQTAEDTVKEAVKNFRKWLDNLKLYKQDPSRFTGKPRMPKYCRSTRRTFKVTNQDAVLYPKADGGTEGCSLKLPGFKKKDPICGRSPSNLIMTNISCPSLSRIWPHLFTPICLTWQDSISGRTTSQLSHARTERPSYTRAVRSCQRTSSLLNRGLRRYPSSQGGMSISMRTPHIWKPFHVSMTVSSKTRCTRSVRTSSVTVWTTAWGSL